MGKIADRVMKMMSDGASSAAILAEIIRMEDGGGIPAGQLHEEFMQWWSAYPMKTGKLDAKRAFEVARRRAPLQVLLDGVRRYAAKRDDRPWCNPGTWLRQGRWEDEVATPVLRNDSLGASFLTAAMVAKEREDGEVKSPDLFGGSVRQLSGR